MCWSNNSPRTWNESEWDNVIARLRIWKLYTGKGCDSTTPRFKLRHQSTLLSPDNPKHNPLDNTQTLPHRVVPPFDLSQQHDSHPRSINSYKMFFPATWFAVLRWRWTVKIDTGWFHVDNAIFLYPSPSAEESLTVPIIVSISCVSQTMTVTTTTTTIPCERTTRTIHVMLTGSVSGR